MPPSQTSDYVWREVWKELRARGWKAKKPSTRSHSIHYSYFDGNIVEQERVHGKNLFYGEDEVMAFARKTKILGTRKRSGDKTAADAPTDRPDAPEGPIDAPDASTGAPDRRRRRCCAAGARSDGKSVADAPTSAPGGRDARNASDDPDGSGGSDPPGVHDVPDGAYGPDSPDAPAAIAAHDGRGSPGGLGGPDVPDAPAAIAAHDGLGGPGALDAPDSPDGPSGAPGRRRRRAASARSDGKSADDDPTSVPGGPDAPDGPTATSDRRRRRTTSASSGSAITTGLLAQVLCHPLGRQQNRIFSICGHGNQDVNLSAQAQVW